MSPLVRSKVFQPSRLWAWLALTAGLFFVGCQDGSFITEPESLSPPALNDVAQDPSQDMQGNQVGPDDWIVVFREGTNDPPGLARRLTEEHGGTVRYTYSYALQGFSGNLPPQAIQGIRRNPNVAFVERNGLVQATAVNSWGLDRIDERDLPMDGLYAPPGDGTGVTVYILDTGIDLRLADRFPGGLSSGPDYIDNDWDSSDLCHGHGTHVAGTVGSLDYGVATEAHIVAVRVLGCSGSGSYDGIIAAINWVMANANKPAIINMSLSGGFSSSVNTAVKNAFSAGVVSSVAAGNASTNACSYSPASAPEAITVASSTSADARSSFSNFGNCVDLFAPGSGITSLVIGGGEESWNGTSMAAPHVAGVAAILMEANPGLDAGGVWAAMQAQATPDKIFDAAGSPNLLLYSGTVTPDPCPGGDCPDVILQWISPVSVKTLKNNKASGTVTVQVAQVEGAEPAGAADVVVNGHWTVDGSTTFAASGVTGADGKVGFNSGQFRNAAGFQFCVTGLGGDIEDVGEGVDYSYTVCSEFGQELGVTPPPPPPPPNGDAPTLTSLEEGSRGVNITVRLDWTGGDALVDVKRDGSPVAIGIENAFTYTDKLGKNPSGVYTYTVCNAGTNECSAPGTVNF